MISNIDHPGNFPFHTLSAPTSLIIPLLGSAHSLRYLVYFAHYIYANSTMNIDPSTPLRCRDSDASQ
ncbi:hypothetical protein N7537_002885 [Penicillium hordei]|uniref:Uncharacterized protein n=1 Tax=Penicillium hordei TaxID=40994 RepID=A0AAD6EIA6_9EURO|nr:uncharacterized protein N7537_002885 [Penicillium hordei]KAJ5617771.1 hypothetical protein N7537_002885 [Penicillium hordei]